MSEDEISPDHPRATSLRIRSRLSRGFQQGITSLFGLFAHGRGEAFDYLIGEQTTDNAKKAMRAAAAALLTAAHPVLSVNGNAAALTPTELVELAQAANAKLEVNLFHRSPERLKAIAHVLRDAGAHEILGVDEANAATIPEIHSDRRRVDRRGLFVADVAFVPLEDGDRTEALVKLGKRVIAVDLNPLSRTAQKATITIVDNIVRALPVLIQLVKEMRPLPMPQLGKIANAFDNDANLREALDLINRRLAQLAGKAAEHPVDWGDER
jgi:4-phosphopantoate--beta-alanine ligase